MPPEAKTFPSDENATHVALVPEELAGEATGELVLGSDGVSALVLVQNMPPLPADQAYQLWLVQGDERYDGGTYDADDEIWLIQFPLNYDLVEVVGVTIEPQGGSPVPTGPRVMSVNLTLP